MRRVVRRRHEPREAVAGCAGCLGLDIEGLMTTTSAGAPVSSAGKRKEAKQSLLRAGIAAASMNAAPTTELPTQVGQLRFE